MWKQPEEITEHNQSLGRPERFDPAQWLHTLVVEVETLWLEGDEVVLAGCCESVRARRADVIAWREMPGRDGNQSTYEVRVREGAEMTAQRVVKASREQPECPRCGRSWDGLPPARGPNEREGERGPRGGRDRGPREGGQRGGRDEGGGCCSGGGEREARGGDGCCGERCGDDSDECGGGGCGGGGCGGGGGCCGDDGPGPGKPHDHDRG